MSKEEVLRGTGKARCIKEGKKANIYYLNDATWTTVCEFGCRAEDNMDAVEFWKEHYVKLS